MHNPLQEATAAEYRTVTAGGGRVLVDFYSDNCGPCKMMALVVGQVATETPDVTCIKVNLSKNAALGEEIGIGTVPAFVYYKGGQEVSRLLGVQSKDKIATMIIG